jgi:site-specific DNA-methyltransferase (adenine-specific)
MIELNKIYNENCLDTLAKIKDNTIDLTITSPPYDDLRTYNDHIKGNKTEFNGYSFDFENIARELYRTTKKGGVVVWVVGDGTENGSETGTSFRQALFFKEIGFKLHDTMIYMKNNFSNPSSTRYHQIFEYMFVFSKGKPNTFNSIKDRKNIYAGVVPWGKNTVTQKDGTKIERPKKAYSDYGQRYNIWKYKTSKNGQEDEIAYQHPAIFPLQLVKDHVISWSNENDLVYDPFMGSGTTARGCKQLNRNFIGSELNPDYVKIAEERLTLKDKEIKNSYISDESE